MNTEDQPIFQAIGTITGEVRFSEDRAFIYLGDSLYPLTNALARRNILNKLKTIIEETGNSKQTLRVYPKVLYFRDGKPHFVGFEIVTILKESPVDNEFTLSGWWHYIPQCKTPCITIKRNATPEVLRWFKKKKKHIKQKIARSIHLPLFWKDPVIPPTQYNDELPKTEQSKPWFVCVKAKFVPRMNMFVFDSLVRLPQPESPKYLKVNSKKKTNGRQFNLYNQPQESVS